jgi:hypothetical protein
MSNWDDKDFQCPQCGKWLPNDANYCCRCRYPLTEQARIWNQIGYRNISDANTTPIINTTLLCEILFELKSLNTKLDALTKTEDTTQGSSPQPMSAFITDQYKPDIEDINQDPSPKQERKKRGTPRKNTITEPTK